MILKLAKNLAHPTETFEYGFQDSFKDLKVLVFPWNGAKLAKDFNLIKNVKENFDVAFCKYTSHYEEDVIEELARLNIKYVFSPNVKKTDQFPFKTFAYPDYFNPKIYPSSNKQFDCSFIGWKSAPIRKIAVKILNETKSINGYGKLRDKFHFRLSNTEQEENELEYLDVLLKSRFSFCPRGWASSSMRLWDCLKAEVIPIILSDKLILPDWDWDDCLYRLHETEFIQNPEKIMNLIKNHDIGKEKEMSSACGRAFNYFCNHESLASYIKCKIE